MSVNLTPEQKKDLEEFAKNTLFGEAKEIPYKPLTPDEEAIFDSDWNTILDNLSRLDPEIADWFDSQRKFYKIAAGIAKATFSGSTVFGGLNPSSGQFGFQLIFPRAFIGANTWVKTISSAGWNDMFGSSSSPITGSTTSGQQRMYYYQGWLIYYGIKPVAWRLHHGAKDYPVFYVEPQMKIPKTDKYITLLKSYNNILVTPTGSHYIRMLFLETGEIEIQPLGLIYAEYDYLKSESTFYA